MSRTGASSSLTALREAKVSGRPVVPEAPHSRRPMGSRSDLSLPPPTGDQRRLSQALLYPLVGAALVLFALWAINPIPCSDLWWQLKTGELIWTEHAIPRTDRFSFMTGGHVWIIQEWATEVLFYLLFTRIGPAAMVVFKMLTFAGAMGLGLAAAWTRCRSGLVALAAALFIGYAAHFYADMRPQMLSFLFLAALLLILERDRAVPGSRARWLIPPLMLVWVNCHAAYMAGVTVLLATLAGAALDTYLCRRTATGARSVPEHHHIITSSHHQSRHLLLPALLALAATAVNPYGFQIYVYPFTLLSHNSMINFVQEWFSPDFHSLDMRWFEASLFLLPAALMLSRRPKLSADFMLAAFWAHQALQSRRHVPIFLLLMLPILAEHGLAAGKRLIEQWKADRYEAAERRALATPASRRGAAGSRCGVFATSVVLLLAISLGIAQQAWALPRTGLFDYSACVSFFPRAACDFIERQNWPGRMYNEFNWGGYCIWRFYPRQQVFIDGRCEVYFGGAWENHQAIHYAQADWEERLRGARIDTLLVSPDSFLNRVLPASLAWQCVYADPLAMVYRRKQPFAR